MESMSLQQRIDEHNKGLAKKLGNYKDLSISLGISENKAKELMRRADAPVVKIGRNKYVILSKIDKWLDEMIKCNSFC